jgi:hypothetical protein
VICFVRDRQTGEASSQLFLIRLLQVFLDLFNLVQVLVYTGRVVVRVNNVFFVVLLDLPPDFRDGTSDHCVETVDQVNREICTVLAKFGFEIRD